MFLQVVIEATQSILLASDPFVLFNRLVEFFLQIVIDCLEFVLLK